MKIDNANSISKSKENLKSFILQWNIRFKYDRLFRKKYNIPFGSKAHLEANQIDMYIDILEDIYINNLDEKYRLKQNEIADYKKNGVFLRESVSEEEDEKLFKKARFK